MALVPLEIMIRKLSVVLVGEACRGNAERHASKGRFHGSLEEGDDLGGEPHHHRPPTSSKVASRVNMWHSTFLHRLER